MPRGARIAGWVYFPIHVAVLPLTIGVLLMAVLGKLPSDVTCNVLYYLIGLVFTLAVMWRFLHRSYDTMAGSILRCVGMMLADEPRAELQHEREQHVDAVGGKHHAEAAQDAADHRVKAAAQKPPHGDEREHEAAEIIHHVARDVRRLLAEHR